MVLCYSDGTPVFPMRKSPRPVVGDLGWSDGDAIKVKEVIDSKTMGVLVCCECIRMEGEEPKKGDSYMYVFSVEQGERDGQDFIGPDCNGDLPNSKWFMKKAPWPDYKGNDIYAGDTIKHPTGQTGTVVEISVELQEDAWRVDYGDDGYLSRLCLQIGNKGQAEKVF